VRSVAARYPSGWAAYRSTVGRPNQAEATFATRFRLVASFRETTFVGLRAQTAAAYSAGQRAVLVVSAAEALTRLSGTPRSVEVPELAERCRPHSMVLSRLTVTGLDSAVRRKITALREHRSDDVWPVVCAVRHLHAHGRLTAQGAGLTTKSSVSLIHDLIDASITSLDEDFSAWAASRKHKLRRRKS
jgi:hypothetical protein